MAKAGFWLRGAKGKLAGASMGKGVNGQTIMREIVMPKNPKTNAQMIQRAIMATVMRAYSAGKEIFDHSFQGRSVGAANQHYFIARNSRLVRAQIETDFNAEYVKDQKARVVAPGAIVPVPQRYLASEGSYSQSLFKYEDTSNPQDGSSFMWQSPKANEKETVAAYAARVGLIAGDIYTAVAFFCEHDTVMFEVEGVDSDFAKQRNCQFGYIRLKVKSNLDQVTDALTNISQLFEIETKNANTDQWDGVYDQLRSTPIFSTASFAIDGSATSDKEAEGAYIAIIRSREDQDLRSTSYFEYCGTPTHVRHWDDNGIAPAYLLDAWKSEGNKLGDSELILEGATNAARIPDAPAQGGGDDGD